MTPEELIELLGLEPLPIEGGYFRNTYYSAESIPQSALPERFLTDKAFGSCIFYLLTPDTFSEFHSLKSDEIYHFYLGDPVELIELHPSGECTTTVLGPDIASNQHLQHVVARGTWQASRLLEGGQFALMGCTMAPAFDYDDYESGYWESLLRQFPKHHQLIMKLTRK